MKPLMPTIPKGLNVFHASQAMPDGGPGGDVGNDESGLGGANVDEEQEDDAGGVDENQLQTLLLEIEADEEHIPWSQSPTPRTRSRSPCALINHKRKHSMISSGTASISSTTQKRTRRDASSAGALQGLSAQLNSFSDTFLEGVALTAAAPSLLAPSPLRKTRAITRAQELEVDLDDGKLAALIRIFQSDVNAADAYMVITREGLRKAWIEDTLPII
jgi:hypothetical protein